MDRYYRALALFSMALRRLGKVLAFFNAAWIVAACVFQFSNVFNQCYCNASVLGLGSEAYSVMSLKEEDEKKMRQAWTLSVALAITGALLFVAFVQIFIDPPLPVEEN